MLQSHFQIFDTGNILQCLHRRTKLSPLKVDQVKRNSVLFLFRLSVQLQEDSVIFLFTLQ